MKKILVLANSIVGLFSFRKEVVKSILSEGYKVYISVPKGEKDKEQYFINEGCILIHQEIDRRGTNPIRDLNLLLDYHKLIRTINPIAVLTYTIKPNIYGGFAARINNVPLLANITGLGSSINGTGFLSKISLQLYKVGLSKAHTIFYQNQQIRDFCSEHNIKGKNNILLPGSGVNLNWHLLQPYPTKESIINFLFIGRIMKDKGIEEFLSMVEHVNAKYDNVNFQVLGSCEEDYKKILNKYQNEGFLQWYSHVSDVRPFIKLSHCTILPSYHEGMANVLLESCAAGRPIITTNINGCKEAVDDGVNGFLCEVKNSKSLIEKVERFIKLSHEEKTSMGLAARKKVEREFDRNIVVNTYLKEIRNIIAMNINQ